MFWWRNSTERSSFLNCKLNYAVKTKKNKKHIIVKQGKYQICFPSNICIYLKFMGLNSEHT